MGVQTEFTKTLLDCILTFDSFDFEVKGVKFTKGEFQRKSVICQISVIELRTKLKMTLKVSRQDMTLKLISPLKGIESSACHIPVFANPIGRGYINEEHDNFSERGANSLLSAMKDVTSIFKLTTLSPNVILTYYYIAFEKARMINQKAEFGKLCPQTPEGKVAYSFLTKNISSLFGFNTFCEQDLLISLQNIINNNYEIFETELN